MQCHLKRIPYTTWRTDNHQLHTCSLEYGVDLILLKDSEFRLFRIKHTFDINFIRQTGFIQTSNRFYLNAWPACAWLPAIALVRCVGTYFYILRIHSYHTQFTCEKHSIKNSLHIVHAPVLLSRHNYADTLCWNTGLYHYTITDTWHMKI